MFRSRLMLGALCFIILAVLVYASLPQSRTAAPEMLTPLIDPRAIAGIEISRGSEVIRLVQRDEKWFIADNASVEVAIESGRVDAVFDFLNGAQILQKVPQSGQASSNAGLADEAAVRLQLQWPDNETRTFHLGRDKNYSMQFVRTGLGSDICLVSKRLMPQLAADMWFSRTILDYDLSMLDRIEYACDKKKHVAIEHDRADNRFIITDGGQKDSVKDLDYVRSDFARLTVSRFILRAKLQPTAPLVEHRLIFGGNAVVRLCFLKARDEKAKKFFLDIRVEPGDGGSEQLQYLQNISRRYVFELPRFDAKKYQAACGDFFEKNPVARDKKIGGKLIEKQGPSGKAIKKDG